MRGVDDAWNMVVQQPRFEAEHLFGKVAKPGMQPGELRVDLGNALAVVADLGFDQLRPALLEQIGDGNQAIGAPLRIVTRPGTLAERAMRGLDGAIGVARIAARECSPDLGGGRVDRFDVLAVLRRLPATVDKVIVALPDWLFSTA